MARELKIIGVNRKCEYSHFRNSLSVFDSYPQEMPKQIREIQKYHGKYRTLGDRSMLVYLFGSVILIRFFLTILKISCMRHKGKLKGLCISDEYNLLMQAKEYSPKFLRITKFLLGFLLVLSITGCQKQPSYGPPTETDVRFLGHRGGGNTSFFNSDKIENTIPSVQEGLKTMNGVEVDVQMSLDGTIWMFHNVEATSCNSSDHHCIVLLKDNEIEKIQICSTSAQDRIYKLEELIKLWNSTSDGFIISLHIKLDFSSDTINNPLIGGKTAYLANFANSLAVLLPVIKHQDQLHIEVFNAIFCKNIHTILPGIKVCLMEETTFTKQINDALASGYDGVSSSFESSTLTSEEVKRARDSGLIVQLWTPDNKDDLMKAFNLNPNFIQTNNLKAISLLNLKVKL